MSRWSRLTQNHELYGQIQDYYLEVFPFELRHYLCEWIEEKQWHMLDPDNPCDENQAARLLQEMLEQLRLKQQELIGDDFFSIRMRLDRTYREFQRLYRNNVMAFLRLMKECVEKEMEVLRAVNTSDTPPTEMDEARLQRETTDQQIITELQEFLRKTQSTQRKFKEMQQKQESFIIQYQEHSELSKEIKQLQTEMETLNKSPSPSPEKYPQLQERQRKEKVLLTEMKRKEIQLSECGQYILAARIELANQYKQLIEDLQAMQRRILDEELIDWKRRQQLAGNGNPLEPFELEMLQRWCESLAEIIWSIWQQIRKMKLLQAQLPINLPPDVKDHVPELNKIITSMLSSLITRTFIVEQQPPQVLRKESRFNSTVCLLVGKKLNIQMNPPVVQAHIISEEQAKSRMQSDSKAKMQNSGKILNNVGTMESGDSTGSAPLSLQLRNMQLKEIKRSGKKGSEAVTEGKFCILFESNFDVGSNIVIQAWTLSLPIVVTVHGNQECSAMATILWDNAFSEPGREPFVVPESVPWPELGEQLSTKFEQMTGRGLSTDNLDYLARKIFGSLDVDYADCSVSWVQFHKDTLKDHNFTFWEWFYAALKLTREHLKGPWADGHIIGFISKLKALECLSQKENGTFLLRFSDSECGGITIACIAQSLNNPSGRREMLNLGPSLSRDFARRGLADSIKDLKRLKWLYPNTPKDSAFDKYYTNQDQERKYVILDGVKFVYYNLKTTTTGPPQQGGQLNDMDAAAQQDILPAFPAAPSLLPNISLPDHESIIPLVDYLTGETNMLVTDCDGNMATDYEPIDMATDYDTYTMGIDVDAFSRGFGNSHTF